GRRRARRALRRPARLRLRLRPARGPRAVESDDRAVPRRPRGAEGPGGAGRRRPRPAGERHRDDPLGAVARARGHRGGHQAGQALEEPPPAATGEDHAGPRPAGDRIFLAGAVRRGGIVARIALVLMLAGCGLVSKDVSVSQDFQAGGGAPTDTPSFDSSKLTAPFAADVSKISSVKLTAAVLETTDGDPDL